MLRRECSRRRVKADDGPRGCTGHHGVDHHRERATFPRVQHPPRVTISRHQVDTREVAGRQFVDHQQPNRVVTAIPIPDPSTTGSATVDLEPKEVGGAGDARVVVSDGLLQPPLQGFVLHLDVPFEYLAEVLLDGQLVLRGRRNNLGIEDAAVVTYLVPVVEQAPGASVAPWPTPATSVTGTAGAAGFS